MSSDLDGSGAPDATSEFPKKRMRKNTPILTARVSVKRRRFLDARLMDEDFILEGVASVRNRQGAEGLGPEDLASARIFGVGDRILLPAEMIFEMTGVFPLA